MNQAPLPEHKYVAVMSDLPPQGFQEWVDLNQYVQHYQSYGHKLIGRYEKLDQYVPELPEEKKTVAEPEAGRKFDSGKLRYSLLPLGTIEEVLRVLEYDAKKYAVDNWKFVPDAEERYYDAAMHHMQAHRTALVRGIPEELRDAETDCSHLAHAICYQLFSLWFELEARRKDATK